MDVSSWGLFRILYTKGEGGGVNIKGRGNNEKALNPLPTIILTYKKELLISVEQCLLKKTIHDLSTTLGGGRAGGGGVREYCAECKWIRIICISRFCLVCQRTGGWTG